MYEKYTLIISRVTDTEYSQMFDYIHLYLSLDSGSVVSLRSLFVEI